MLLNRADIQDLDKRRRAALINSITGFKPANLIGSADREGRSNLAIMSSLVHLGSHPPLLGLIIRPDGVPRHTLENIRATGFYSVNHVHHEFVAAAHQTAARYPREVSEFSATGLTERWIDGFAAPLVEEASVRMLLALREEVPLAINGTLLLIGEIEYLEFPDSATHDTGALDPALAGSVAISGLDSYHPVHPPQRMPYAKADEARQGLQQSDTP